MGQRNEILIPNCYHDSAFVKAFISTSSNELVGDLVLQNGYLSYRSVRCNCFVNQARAGSLIQVADNRFLGKQAERIGLRQGTPVVAGGGDQSAQAVGVGVVHPGTMAVTLGTSGVVFAATELPLTEPRGRLHAFCHAVGGRWHLMGVMHSAAGSFQ